MPSIAVEDEKLLFLSDDVDVVDEDELPPGCISISNVDDALRRSESARDHPAVDDPVEGDDEDEDEMVCDDNGVAHEKVFPFANDPYPWGTERGEGRDDGGKDAEKEGGNDGDAEEEAEEGREPEAEERRMEEEEEERVCLQNSQILLIN